MNHYRDSLSYDTNITTTDASAMHATEKPILFIGPRAIHQDAA